MKVCENCGAEITTKDGNNLCQYCGSGEIRRKAASARRREREAVMQSLGLVKVKGALGGTYWE